MEKNGDLTQDEFNKFFSKNPDATPMSSWIFRRAFMMANEVSKLPSKSLIFSVSTGSLFRFLDYNADGVIDIREFLQGLSALCQAPDSDFVKVVYQMYLRDSELGNENFNVDGFEICLTQFVPKRIIKNNASNMEELDLKRLESNDKYGPNHPVSMYDRIFTFASSPLETDKRRKRSRVRITSEDEVNESSRSRSQRILLRRWESKSEREQNRPVASAKTSDKDWMVEDEPFMAVDRRLAERMQQWRQGKVGSEGQVMPSYLIGYVPYNQETSEETLEVQSLEICVRAVTGIKVKYLPLEGLITNVKPPKNKCLRELFFPGGKQVSPKKHYVSGGESNSSDVGNVRHRYPKSSDPTVYVRKRSASLVASLTDATLNNNPDFLVISTQKLASKSLRFAFSRCHTVSEVFEAICKYYVDYRGCDLDSENCRMWLVVSSDPSEISTRSRNRAISKTSTNVGNSSHSEYAADTTNESTGCFGSKRLTLMPIDLKTVGDQQLARYLADLENSSGRLLNPKVRCSRTFDFIIECRIQFLFWALNQLHTKGSQFTGLKNLGNTCYMNSVIQCLKATPELTKKIKHYVTPDTELAKEYVKLLDQMQISGEPLNPQPLRRAFVQKWPNFNSYAQQDAQEFLTIFLDSLNEELRRKPQPEENGLSKSFDNHVSKKRHELFSASRIWDTFCADNDSPVVKMFYGLCESKCKFDGCSHSSSAFDPFSSLTLPLPFNTIESITLTVVPQFGAVPEVIQIKSDKTIDFAFVREEIARRYKCSANCIFFVRLVSGTFKVPSNTAILEETVYTLELVGDPTVIQVPINATNKDLYNVVGKAIRRFVRSSQDPKKHSNCSRTATFLNSSNDDGLEKCTRKCTALHFEMCRGCQVPVNSDKLDLICTADTCVYLAVDWNLAAYVNEYQQTQETKKKIVDPIEDRDNLNMKNACQLDCLLQSYFETEDASKEECVTCERCDKRKCFSKSTAICVLPHVLLISLKRFQASKCGWRKLTTPVEFPLSSLDMRPYLSEDVRIKETIYDLYGVVNHTGTLNEGHYYAHIKSESNGLWFRVNDVQFNEIPIQSVVTPDAYVLFYQRRMK
ncbi:unnamed protein product [Hymenolepis diminuta]|uniref:ubiquitinyl hydrolase 1 n=1 Tax=Hymenolepis diminuta TaxID=6216 RepID=A0A158QDY8_HYMDI|nr:unnamed protein product [Hymenolepis diminuta]